MANKKDRHSLCFQTFDDLEQVSVLATRDSRCRLIHDQYTCIDRKRLSDLPPLPFGEAQHFHRTPSIDLNLQPGQEFLCPPTHCGPTNPAKTPRCPPNKDVSANEKSRKRP